MLALVTTFVFYAKASNPEVPYVFWFAVSLAFYVRAIRTGARLDVVGLFVAAAAAICTKDQAYALYLSVPFVLAYRLAPTRGSWRTLAIGLASAALVFAAVHDIPFNLSGFVSHVRDISGPGRDYRMFDATPGGEWSLLRLSVDLDRRSFGWPMFLISLAGVLTALRDRLQRQIAVPLLLIGLTYYGAFVAVILYDYDRYLLPIAVLQAIFGGVAIDRFLAAGGGAVRRAAVAAVFAYSVLYAATVDVLMTRDSRYAAERWLVEHAPHGHLVATAFPLTILPRMQNLDSVDIGTVENLRRWNPEYFVLNADYARALRPDSAPARLAAGLADGSLGYRVAARFRAPSPWPWLPGAHPDLIGPRDETPVASILRDINPTIEVYDRDRSR